MHLLLYAAGAILFLSYGYTEMAGSDMWWHLAAGRELLQTGSLWMVDDWSYTARGHDWLNHEWLADIIFYAWASLWGVAALVYWKWLVIVATFVILQRALTRASGSALAGLVCAALAIAIAAPFLDVRPHLYSLALFSLLLYLLLGRRTSTWWLAGIFLVWVNLHGGFFFGLMALGVLVFPWRQRNAGTLRAALAVGAVCLLASALNPAGFKAFLYPLKYAFDDTSPFRQLGEWLPPFQPGGIRSPLFFVFMWAPALAACYLLPRVRRATGVPWEGLALTALTLAMALTSRRFIPLYGISLAVLLAPLVGFGLRRLQRRPFGLPLALVALLLGAARMLPYPLQSGPAFHYLTAEYAYPMDMLDFIRTNDIRGNVFALYNWGGYIHWRSDGDLRVYMDGRADTLYDAATYNDYMRVLFSRPGWIELVESSGAQYMLWPHQRSDGQNKLRQLLDTGHWRGVYSDSVSWLLARDTAPLSEPLRSAPASPWQDMSIAQISAWRGDRELAIEYAEKVRRAMPWHKGACNLLRAAYRESGQPQRSQQVLRECFSYFPSYLLQ